MSRAKKLTALSTTAAVIKAIGDGYEGVTPIQAVAKLLRRDYNAAANWPHQCTFPSNTHAAMKRLLEARGYTAPDSLWKMTEEAPVA